jgi:hypothetical protein
VMVLGELQRPVEAGQASASSSALAAGSAAVQVGESLYSLGLPGSG